MTELQTNIVNALMAMGVNRKEAMCLAILDIRYPISTVDIENQTHLRQPEVSKAMTSLNAKNYVICSIKSSGKGRPTLIYTIRKSHSDILKEIKSQYDDIRELKMKQINDLIKSYTRDIKE